MPRPSQFVEGFTGRLHVLRAYEGEHTLTAYYRAPMTEPFFFPHALQGLLGTSERAASVVKRYGKPWTVWQTLVTGLQGEHFPSASVPGTRRDSPLSSLALGYAVADQHPDHPNVGLLRTLLERCQGACDVQRKEDALARGPHEEEAPPAPSPPPEEPEACPQPLHITVQLPGPIGKQWEAWLDRQQPARVTFRTSSSPPPPLKKRRCH